MKRDKAEQGPGAGASSRVRYIWSPQLQHVADRLPANPQRSSLVHGLVRSLDLVVDAEEGSGSQVVGNRPSSSGDGAEHIESISSMRACITRPDPRLDAEGWIRKYHDSSYVDFLLQSSSDSSSKRDSSGSESSSSSSSIRKSRRKRKRQIERHGLEHDCPRFPGLREYSLLVAESTLTACRSLLDGSTDIAINWDGGRHHAMRNRASGFCYVADAVLGIMLLTKEGTGRSGQRPKVLYLDLDIHYGDGVAQAFISPARYPAELTGNKRPPRPPQVLTLSIHHHSPVFFPPTTTLSGLPDPYTPHPFTLSIPLAAYPAAPTYAAIWESVEKLKNAFNPDYVVLQLGVDGLPEDRIGQCGAWGVDGEGGVRWCLRRVKGWGKPLCVLGGGGYNHPNAARAWTIATGELLDSDIPSDMEIPHHPFFPEYGPSFTLEIPKSNVQDENTAENLKHTNETFEIIAKRIEHFMEAHQR